MPGVLVCEGHKMTVTLQNSWAVSYKIKRTLIYDPVRNMPRSSPTCGTLRKGPTQEIYTTCALEPGNATLQGKGVSVAVIS